MGILVGDGDGAVILFALAHPVLPEEPAGRDAEIGVVEITYPAAGPGRHLHKDVIQPDRAGGLRAEAEGDDHRVGIHRQNDRSAVPDLGPAGTGLTLRHRDGDGLTEEQVFGLVVKGEAEGDHGGSGSGGDVDIFSFDPAADDHLDIGGDTGGGIPFQFGHVAGLPGRSIGAATLRNFQGAQGGAELIGRPDDLRVIGVHFVPVGGKFGVFKIAVGDRIDLGEGRLQEQADTEDQYAPKGMFAMVHDDSSRLIAVNSR